MRLVYSDETGISRPDQEKFCVVSSAIVHPDRDLVAIERHIQKLVAKHIPEEHHDGFSFHAKEIFHGGKIIKRNDPEWPAERRFAIADDLAAIPRKFNLPLAFGWIDYSTFPQTFELPPGTSPNEVILAAHVSAYMTSAMLVEHWMRQNAPNEVCMMIVEDNDRARKLILDTHRYHQDKTIEKILAPEARVHFPFRKIKEDPVFQPKKSSSPLQIVDFCAYVFRRFLMQDRHNDRFAEPLWQQVISFEAETLVPRPARRIGQRAL